MKPSSPGFAFQLRSNEHLFHDGGEILGSKKANVTLADGSTKSVTLFFRAPADKLLQMQANQQADSQKATAASLKAFMLARGVSAANADLAMQKITDNLASTQKEGNTLRRQSEKMLRQREVKRPQLDDKYRRSFAKLKENLQAGKQKRQMANDRNSPQIPASLFSKMFDKAIKDGAVARVDTDLKQAVQAERPKTTKPLPTPPARKPAKPLPPTPSVTRAPVDLSARHAEPKLPEGGSPPLPKRPDE